MIDAKVSLEPRFADGDVMRVIGLAERYDAVTMNRITEQWAHFQQRLGDVRGRIDPAQFGIFYRERAKPFAFEYLTAVMVGEDAPRAGGPRRAEAAGTPPCGLLASRQAVGIAAARRCDLPRLAAALGT